MKTEKKWSELSLRPSLLKIIESLGWSDPTPVQAQSIPLALAGRDVIVSAQTGTGKTGAFAIPLIERVADRQGTYGLVLSPTREIALQTHKTLLDLGSTLGVKSIALIGGTPLREDEIQLRNYPQILVATPGRICDHLERGNIWLEYLEMLVLDEADRMLDMGFSDQLNRILKQTSPERQTLLFSATVSPTVEKLAQKILNRPERIEVGVASKTAHTVVQNFVFTDEDSKFGELRKILQQEPGTVFVFARSKDSAARLWRALRNRGFHEATQLHSDLPQAAREEALADFKSNKYRVLIATDVGGRGIHVDQVSLVVNYDFPRDADDYVHRIGRTGRAENVGKSISLVTKDDQLVLRKVEKILGKRIEGQFPPSVRNERAKPRTRR